MFHRELRLSWAFGSGTRAVVLRTELSVLYLVYVLGVIVLFAVVALVAKAVEKL